jgi:hypothetical protein
MADPDNEPRPTNEPLEVDLADNDRVQAGRHDEDSIQGVPPREVD